MRSRAAFPIEPVLVRYANLVSGNAVALDPRGPGAAPVEHFAIIADDASDSLAAHAPIALPHGFNLAAERRIETGRNAAHTSAAAEVLIVHAGRWRLTQGEAEAGVTDLFPGDVVSIRPNTLRHWEKLDGEVGFLFIVRGVPTDTGAPAQTTLEDSTSGERLWVQDGRFIDFSGGIPRMRDLARPEGDAPMAPCRINAASVLPSGHSALTARGVAEAGIISPPDTRDGFARGAIGAQWPHGFSLRWLALPSGAYVPRHARAESEVILIHTGTLELSWEGGTMMLGAGDVLSVPIGLPHAFGNPTSRRTETFVVRGSDDPAMPQFDSISVAQALKAPLAPART
jgi:quercetin dioxygenase-like cupin family protein